MSYRKIILLLISFSLFSHSSVAGLPGDDPNSGLQALNFIVAVVNDDVILANDLKEQLLTTVNDLRARNVRLPPAQILQKQVLDRLILTKLQIQDAERSGIRIDDDSLNRAIRNIARNNKLTLANFRATLEREGYVFASFRKQIRQQLVISRLRQRKVNNRVSITPQEVDAYLISQTAQGNSQLQFHLSHILLALPTDAAPENIIKTREQAQTLVEELRNGRDFAQAATALSAGNKALEGGDLGWREAAKIPSLFSERVQSMKPGEISDAIRSPAGFHIIKLNASRANEVHMIEQVKGRHILIKTNEIVSDQEARRRLNTIRDRLLAGEDFGTLARSNSDDTGSAANGGDLGWVSPGEMVPQFEKVLFSLPIGDISTPFQSAFGWHIAQAVEKRQHNAAEEDIRNKAAKAIRERKIEEELELYLRRLKDSAFIDYRLNP